MGVYIKGMEMPKDCIVCPFGWNGCNKQHDFVYMGSRPDNCPLVPVTPHGDLVEWIPFESRQMDDEERKYYSEMTGFDMSDDAVIYCSKLPEDGQEVLICDKYGNVWQDIFCNDPEYGVGLETHGDMDGIVAWMPMPKPYKPEEDE